MPKTPKRRKRFNIVSFNPCINLSAKQAGDIIDQARDLGCVITHVVATSERVCVIMDGWGVEDEDDTSDE